MKLRVYGGAAANKVHRLLVTDPHGRLLGIYQPANDAAAAT